jgi:uncharacterized protein (TIGR02597 family)
MKKSAMALGAAGLMALSVSAANAQQQGVVTINVPANSDVVVSIPFNRTPVGEFETASVSGSTLTLQGNPGFASNEFQNDHYVRVIDGSGAGLWATISGNTANQVTLDDSDIAAELDAGGDQTIRIYPHHTVESVFPAEERGVSFEAGTQVQLWDNSAATQNKGPGPGGASTFQDNFLGTGWSNPEMVLPPETAIVIRNSGSSSLTFIAKGLVPDHKVAYLLDGGVNKDTLIGSGYPVETKARFSGLGGADQRQIQLYDNDATGQNKGPGPGGATTFQDNFLGTGWANPDLPIAPGAGFVFRQNGNGSAGVAEATVVYPVATD